MVEKQGVTPANDDRAKEDNLFLSALQSESYRNAILDLLYGREDS